MMGGRLCSPFTWLDLLTSSITQAAPTGFVRVLMLMEKLQFANYRSHPVLYQVIDCEELSGEVGQGQIEFLPGP